MAYIRSINKQIYLFFENLMAIYIYFILHLFNFKTNIACSSQSIDMLSIPWCIVFYKVPKLYSLERERTLKDNKSGCKQTIFKSL